MRGGICSCWQHWRLLRRTRLSPEQGNFATWPHPSPLQQTASSRRLAEICQALSGTKRRRCRYLGTNPQGGYDNG
jgi:hypothetical protein